MLDAEEEMVVSFWLQMVQIALNMSSLQHGGSERGKAANIERDYCAAHQRYMLKYFWPQHLCRPNSAQKGPEQSETTFERRFRMPRRVFNRVCATAIANSEYLRKGLRPNCAGRIGISPLLKVICALRQLSYGIPADLADDLFDVSETTASDCLQAFCNAVISGFSGIYLREPTEEDLVRIEKEFRLAGFPGCIGCLDCSGWQWKNCPKALQGVMTGKEGKPSVRMEVVCSLDLWIWSFQFGLPGSMNDLNILELSDHFNKVLSGTFPQITPSYTITNKQFNWYYYLTDGIYPPWRIFIQSLSSTTDRKGKNFSVVQESIRKCVEQVFGVLYQRFKLLFVACEYWNVDKMRSIATTAVILHNMIVESRRSTYCSDGTGGRSSKVTDIGSVDNLTFVRLPPASMRLANSPVAISDDIKVRSLHRDLKSALIDHMWNLFGSESK